MRISVIIPVYHEEGLIESTISSIRINAGISGSAAEIIVCDGVPGDSTLKAIKDSDVIKVPSAAGRAKQMNTGAKAATGEIFLFLHADSTLPGNAFRLIQETLRDPKISGGAFFLKIESPHPFVWLAAFFTNIRCALTRVPYGDQGIFIRKEVFEAFGGYPDIPIMEEVELMRILKKRHLRIKILRKKIRTSARRWEKQGVFFTTFRNRLLSLLYLLKVSPEKLAVFYKTIK